jgi:hypothetical protein
MTREQTIDAIRVMQAFVDGKYVESMYDGKWSIIYVPRWNWDDTKYRIKPTATLRPWTADEVPLGAWIRRKDALRDNRRVLICETYDESVRSTWRVTSEHSIDGGKTWLPCGVMEDAK